jgi:hypothetical protein
LRPGPAGRPRPPNAEDPLRGCPPFSAPYWLQAGIQSDMDGDRS